MASYSAFNSSWHDQHFFFSLALKLLVILLRRNILGYQTQFSRTRHQLCNPLALAALQVCSSPTSQGSWVPGAWRGSEEVSRSVASPDTLSNPWLTLSPWDKGGLEKQIQLTAQPLLRVTQWNLKGCAEFTWWANQSEAAQVGGVLGSIHPSNVTAHGSSNQVERPFIKANALNKLHKLKD